jgi:hypothetical protein
MQIVLFYLLPDRCCFLGGDFLTATIFYIFWAGDLRRATRLRRLVFSFALEEWLKSGFFLFSSPSSSGTSLSSSSDWLV